LGEADPARLVLARVASRFVRGAGELAGEVGERTLDVRVARGERLEELGHRGDASIELGDPRLPAPLEDLPMLLERREILVEGLDLLLGLGMRGLELGDARLQLLDAPSEFLGIARKRRLALRLGEDPGAA